MWRNKTPPTLVTPYFSKNIDHKTKGDIIMQKKFKIEVDCANCAAKIEDAVKKLPGVNSASVSFMAQKMVLDVDDDKFDTVLKDVVKTAKRVEPDFEIEL
jgi:copper chaperone CopZ